MTGPMVTLRITAVGEVRDAEGNLIETVPIDTTMTVPEAHARALGLTPQETP